MPCVKRIGRGRSLDTMPDRISIADPALTTQTTSPCTQLLQQLWQIGGGNPGQQHRFFWKRGDQPELFATGEVPAPFLGLKLTSPSPSLSRWYRRDYEMHRAAVESARSRTDSSTPHAMTMTHVRPNNAKAMYFAALRENEIADENDRLVSKIKKIISSDVRNSVSSFGGANVERPLFRSSLMNSHPGIKLNTNQVASRSSQGPRAMPQYVSSAAAYYEQDSELPLTPPLPLRSLPRLLLDLPKDLEQCLSCSSIFPRTSSNASVAPRSSQGPRAMPQYVSSAAAYYEQDSEFPANPDDQAAVDTGFSSFSDSDGYEDDFDKQPDTVANLPTIARPASASSVRSQYSNRPDLASGVSTPRSRASSAGVSTPHSPPLASGVSTPRSRASSAGGSARSSMSAVEARSHLRGFMESGVAKPGSPCGSASPGSARSSRQSLSNRGSPRSQSASPRIWAQGKVDPGAGRPAAPSVGVRGDSKLAAQSARPAPALVPTHSTSFSGFRPGTAPPASLVAGLDQSGGNQNRRYASQTNSDAFSFVGNSTPETGFGGGVGMSPSSSRGSMLGELGAFNSAEAARSTGDDPAAAAARPPSRSQAYTRLTATNLLPSVPEESSNVQSAILPMTETLSTSASLGTITTQDGKVIPLPASSSSLRPSSRAGSKSGSPGQKVYAAEKETQKCDHSLTESWGARIIDKGIGLRDGAN
eukprot:gene7706-874_t